MNMEIPKASDLEEKVFTINNEKEFELIALEVYHFQFACNSVYRHYCELVHKTPSDITSIDQIPFLPVSFFKTHKVTTTDFQPELVFKSSGTTGSVSSTHYLKKASLYEKSFSIAFERFYGPVDQYCIIGLLPSYLERGNSSLVYMVDHLIRKSGHRDSGFYLNEFEKLYSLLIELEKKGQKVLLIGVTYALLDFASQFSLKLNHTIIMETGGMKGRKKEMIRSELYELLKADFGVRQIHSEYGMTELLSQAYSIDGKFTCPPWMKIVLRDETDPFTIANAGNNGLSGAINVIDLANIYSCSFIATEDVGQLNYLGSFEVLGRMDNSDIRGCSLMVV